MTFESWQGGCIIAAGYSFFILVLWNLPYLRHLLWPFKILTVALHEFGHASAGVLTGAKIESITLDPDEGGITKMRGGNPYIVLPAGYIGSTFWGSIMVFSGFDQNVAKVTSIIVMLIMAVTIFWARNWLGIFINTIFIGAIILLWIYADNALALFILFLGVMSSLYSLWDIVDDLIKRRVNESDATQFSRLFFNGKFSPRFWLFVLTKGPCVVFVLASVFGWIHICSLFGFWPKLIKLFTRMEIGLLKENVKYKDIANRL